jgi:hypothetical protein
MFGLDLVGVGSDVTRFGYRNKNWKSWTLPDGTPALASERFTATGDSNAALGIAHRGYAVESLCRNEMIKKNYSGLDQERGGI